MAEEDARLAALMEELGSYGYSAVPTETLEGGEDVQYSAASSQEGTGDLDAPSEDEIAAFVAQWSLNDDAVTKLSKLSPSLQRIAMQDFSPKAPAPGIDLTGKFIMFVAMLERGHGRAEIAAGPNTDELMEFQMKWELNEDAMTKLAKVPPPVQQIAMRDFNPKDPTPGVDLSGKFIMFVAMLERNSLGKSSGSKGKGKDMFIGMDKGKGKGMKGVMMGNMWDTQHVSKGKGKMSKGGSSYGGGNVAIDQFCQHWSLNEDAKTKLHKLTPAVCEMVMAQFAPPQSGADLSGKLIMFAASLEKAHAGGGKGCSGGGKGYSGGGKGYSGGHDVCGEFCQYWGLNEDA